MRVEKIPETSSTLNIPVPQATDKAQYNFFTMPKALKNINCNLGSRRTIFFLLMLNAGLFYTIVREF
jgi:hypothetical protein